jgi:phage terminase small subunit
MEQITRDEVIKILVKNNAKLNMDLLCQYADAYLEYKEASINIEENGLIVKHPRTMNPIENPYMPVRDRALKKLRQFSRVNSTGLW